MPTIVAANEPELANQMLERALSMAEAAENPQSSVPQEAPKAETPPECSVKLPCGFFSVDEGLVFDAEIRELNGYDEEALTKAQTPAQMLQLMLERAVVRIGEKKPTKGDIEELTSGDAEMLIVAIRRATYGDADYVAQCPSCREVSTVTVDLGKDIPIKTLSSEDRNFTVTLRNGKAAVLHLPTWKSQRDISDNDGMTVAEIATAVLKDCVESIDDSPLFSEAEVKQLSARDRATLLKAIEDRIAGPRLGEVKKACPACEDEITLPQLTLPGMFPL